VASGVGLRAIGDVSPATVRRPVGGVGCRPVGVPGVCAAGPASRVAQAQVRPVARPDGTPDGVVIVSPRGLPAHLTGAEWASYRGIGGGSAERAAGMVGYPSPPEVRIIQVRVWLSRGGLLVGRRADSPLFWLPAVALRLWHRHGGATGELGLPTSGPYRVGDEVRLDFEGGEMRARTEDLDALLAGDANSPGLVTVDPIPAAERAARLGPPPRGVVVRQLDGTTWWVDAQGRRHWVDDGPTAACYGNRSVAQDHVPGWAIASLPLGEPARCP
jgi:hypothetical protein